ncbi:MAG: hypothetical protein HY820_06700 [Acidobacteria bacterium]|nr:hypothetical protein [Acidobacteriota bacterium]
MPLYSLRPIHKDLDRRLKAFPDEAPRIFLHMIHVLDRNAEATVEILSNETSPPVKIPDFVARISIYERDAFLLHTEFEAVWNSRVPPIVARRGASLAWQYETPVRSVVVIIQREGCPAMLPSEGEYVIGQTRTTHPFEAMKMWEMDPHILLESGDSRLMVWAVLMNSSDEEVRMVFRRAVSSGDEDLISRLFTFAGVRYDENKVERLKEACNMGILEAIEQVSWSAQLLKKARREGVEEGIQLGIEKGIEKERVEAQTRACRVLCAGLAAKYPGLESMPEIHTISDIALLERLLLDHVIGTSDRLRAEQAIREAARTAS